MNEPKLRFKADDGNGFPEWETKEISSYLSIRNEKQVPTEEAPLKAFIANMGVADKGDRYDRSFLVKSEDKKYKRTELNDFIYSSNNLDVGSIGLNTYGTAVISDVYEVFKTNENVVPTVLDLAIQRKAVISAILRFRQGCLYGQYRIYPEDFLSVEISMPSFPEQQKIADFISKLDAIIEQTQSEIDAWEKQKRGVMQMLFSRKVRFKADDGSEFPEWEEKRLNEICDIVGGGTPSTKQKEYWNGDVLWISSSDVKENNVRYINKNRHITQEAIEHSATKRIPAGSVLIVSRVGVGKVVLTDEELCTSQDFTNMMYISEEPLFIAYYMSHRMQQEATAVQGTAIKGIPSKHIQDYSLQLPCHAEQQKIAACLSRFDDVIDKAKKELEAYRELKKGLLQQMFV